MDADAIGRDLIEHGERLEEEINRVWKVFSETAFLGDNKNLPHAHWGYLMGLFSLVDVLAVCDPGVQSGVSQAKRMRAFLDAYVWPGRTQVHRVLVQMLRHTLMHTGALNYVYEPNTATAYGWRWVGYGGEWDPYMAHATITDEPISMMDHLRGYADDAGVVLNAAGILNISLHGLAADLLAGTRLYVATMLADPVKKTRAESVYPKLRMQPIGP